MHPDDTKLHRHSRRRGQQGFTLVEVLIALVVFALGMLGISLYSGNALQVAATNATRAQALYDASQVMNSFYAAANAGPDSFKAALSSFGNDSNDMYANSTVLQGSGTRVQISAARDSSPTPKDLLTTDAADWVSPLTIAVTVVFEGGNDNDPSNDKVSRASYTFLLP